MLFKQYFELWDEAVRNYGLKVYGLDIHEWRHAIILTTREARLQTLHALSWLLCSSAFQARNCGVDCLTRAYPAVLLRFPLGSVRVDLRAGRAVGELEEAGEHAVVFRCVREDGVLEIHSMRDDVVVFIHP